MLLIFALVLSFIFPGLGHFLLGKKLKGIILILSYVGLLIITGAIIMMGDEIIGTLIYILGLLILEVYGMYDVYRLYKAKK